jgi:hypothetical protein
MQHGHEGCGVSSDSPSIIAITLFAHLAKPQQVPRQDPIQAGTQASTLSRSLATPSCTDGVCLVGVNSFQ